MNLAEKIAGTYFRLNEFLTLSHFTAFDGNQHNHLNGRLLRLGYLAVPSSLAVRTGTKTRFCFCHL